MSTSRCLQHSSSRITTHIKIADDNAASDYCDHPDNDFCRILAKKHTLLCQRKQQRHRQRD
eukprot:scaffold103447_cov33-Prasinocladus_malaysianus.AAC.1